MLGHWPRGCRDVALIVRFLGFPEEMGILHNRWNIRVRLPGKSPSLSHASSLILLGFFLPLDAISRAGSRLTMKSVFLVAASGEGGKGLILRS